MLHVEPHGAMIFGVDVKHVDLPTSIKQHVGGLFVLPSAINANLATHMTPLTDVENVSNTASTLWLLIWFLHAMPATTASFTILTTAQKVSVGSETS